MVNRGGGRTDGRTEGWTYGNSPLCPTGHWPFGAAAQKVGLSNLFLQICVQHKRIYAIKIANVSMTFIRPLASVSQDGLVIIVK